MIANNLIEVYTLIFAWNMYGALWDVLINTGLAVVPFIALVINAMGEHHGDDRSSGGTIIKNVESTLIGMLLVLMFCGMPFAAFDGTVSSVKYRLETVDCNALSDPNANLAGVGGDANDSYADSLGSDMAGVTITQPVAWYGVGILSNAITHAAMKSIGCANNYDMMLMRISNVRITDPSVRQEIKDFRQACYNKANALLNDNPVAIPADVSAVDDVDWMGSGIFMNTPGDYYDHPTAYMTNMESKGFTRSATRDTDVATETNANPSCKEVWGGEANGGLGVGLREKILASIPTDKMGSVTGDWEEWGHLVLATGTMAREDQEDLLIKMVIDAEGGVYDQSKDLDLGSEYQVKEGGFFKEMLTVAATLFGSAGASAAKAFDYFAAKALIKVAGPIILAMVQMIIVVAAPLLLVLTGYKFSTFWAMALTYFAFEFINVVWAMVFYMDSHLTKIMMGGQGFIDGTTNTILLKMIFMTLIVVMPMLWLGLFGYAGSGMVRGLAGSAGSTMGVGGGAGKTASGLGSRLNTK